MVFVWVRKFTYLVTSGYDSWHSTLGSMNDMWYHAQNYNNIVHSPICTNVLNMSNPSCIVQPIQDLVIEVDTLGEFYFLTCLTSRPHQSTIKCMPCNGLLIVVVWVLLGESTCFLLTILVLVLIPLVHSLRKQHLYILHTFILNHNMLGQ